MSIQTFFKSLTTSTRRRSSRRSRPAFRVYLESLEDRCVPADTISFMKPIDFATGATPGVTAAFNRAAGDQIATALWDGVAVGDFNHDGKDDVAQTNVIAGRVSVFLGDGNAGFEPVQTYQVGVNPIFVVAGDLNGDTHLDLAVADFGSNDVAILLGNGDGTFQQASFVPLASPSGTGVGPRNVVIGKFNDDAIPDLAVAESDGVAILTGNENGSFTQSFISLSPGANYVAVGDFDGVGFDDLAVGVGSNMNAGDQKLDGTKTGDDVLIFLNHNGTFATTPDHTIRVGATPRAIAVADLNGDQHLDLAVMNANSSDITILMGDGQGIFAAKLTVASTGISLAVGDFNDDGVKDLVTADFYGSVVSVLQGTGNADVPFLPAVQFWAGEAPTGVAVGNFNGDQDQRLDVVVGRLRTDQLSLFLNDSPQPGDGVAITRDIYYLADEDRVADLLAAHHTLDVYSPPEGTTSFAGAGQPYPVVFFVHGGAWHTGDKNHSYLMRSIAREGIVAVSTNYRLAPKTSQIQPDLSDAQVQDVAVALGWVYENVNSYGGDPNNIFAFAHSAGADLVGIIMTDNRYAAEQQLVRGVVLAGLGTSTSGSPPEAGQPPFLLMDGTEGIEPATATTAAAFHAASTAVGAESDFHIIPGRDHMTLLADMALPADPARVFMLDFMQGHLIPNPTSDLQVTNIVAANNRQGDKVTITATIANLGTADVPASQTEFLLDGATVVGLIDTPAIPAGGSAVVSVSLDTKGLKGTHTFRVTADRTEIVNNESDEANNAATLAVTVKGNQAQDGSTVTQESSAPPAAGESALSSEFFVLLRVDDAILNATTAGDTTLAEPVTVIGVSLVVSTTKAAQTLTLETEEVPLDPLLSSLTTDSLSTGLI